MARRSDRLLSTGYYDNNAPQVSYKENPYKVFGRKKGVRRSGASAATVTDNRVTEYLHPNSSGHIFTLFSQTKAVGLLLLLLLCSGGCMYTVGQGGHNVRILQRQLKELQEELLQLRNKVLPVADTMPNFALESQGAFILHHLTTESLKSPSHLVTFWGIPLWYQSPSPQIVIGAHSSPLTPGHCWAFKGIWGQLFIALSHPIRMTHVTLGHISAMQSPSGFPFSAPRMFSVYGLKISDGESIQLGTFLYDPHGDSIQTFELPRHTTENVFRFVKVQIESNWGNSEYTCVYNFRVHGRTP